MNFFFLPPLSFYVLNEARGHGCCLYEWGWNLETEAVFAVGENTESLKFRVIKATDATRAPRDATGHCRAPGKLWLRIFQESTRNATPRLSFSWFYHRPKPGATSVLTGVITHVYVYQRTYAATNLHNIVHAWYTKFYFEPKYWVYQTKLVEFFVSGKFRINFQDQKTSDWCLFQEIADS